MADVMMTVSKDISSTDTLTTAVSPIRVLMAAGGTGGHVYPAIAIADAVKTRNPHAEILFAGTRGRMEWQAVPKSGYPIKSVWISGFHRRFTLQNLLFPVKLVVSLFQSLFILMSFKPDVVVACGGFAAGPIGWVAARLRIPVVIQEQNSFPGVTNRLLAKHAITIFTAFEGAKKHFSDGKKINLVGNPVRQQLSRTERQTALKTFGFRSDGSGLVLLVLGGSGGSRPINQAMIRHLHLLHDNLELQVIWQCGEQYLEEVKARIDTVTYPTLRLVPFIEDMPAAYGAADLVVTRSGASTCSELMAVGLPAVFVPSPHVAGDHQTQNAAEMVRAGAAQLLTEEELLDDKETFVEVVRGLIFDGKRLQAMSRAMKALAKPDAAAAITKEIFTLAENRRT